MKTKSFLFTFFFALIQLGLFAQTPQGFNYQAIAKDGSGNAIGNYTFKVQITLQTTSTGGTILWREQHNSVTTNSAGLFSLVVGKGTRLAGPATFSLVDWTAPEIYIQTTIQYPGTTWTPMGSAQIMSVPYSLVSLAADKITDGKKLTVVGANDLLPDALFEVRRKDGQPVFLVYPDSVRVFVPNSAAKGNRGGFAIGGFDGAKGPIDNYLLVTADCVRVNINNAPGKGNRGGFAIGGYDQAKGTNATYFNLNPAAAVDIVLNSPQVLWYPQKNAFLAGNVRITNIDSVGSYSTALGYQSRASGDYSQAFGYRARADGDYSTSIGKSSYAGTSTTKNAFAFGDYAQALANNSIAFGTKTQSTNTNALAVGNETVASGLNSTAIGYQAQAQGERSIAIGSFYSLSYSVPKITLTPTGGTGDEAFLPVRPITSATTLSRNFNRANIAQGLYSMAVGNGNFAQNGGMVFGSNSDAAQFGAVALGTSAHANNKNSLAFGYESAANGLYSVAIGNNVIANSYGEIALGQFGTTVTGTADTWDENEQLFTLGNGTSDADRSNALTIYKNGKTIVRGRYAYSTFNYTYRRLTGIFPNLYLKDYVYGIYTNLNRDNTSIEYYYSGYFGATGTAGSYFGLYADTRSGGSIDVAEYIYDSKANTEPADVVVADPLSKESVIKSSKPFETSVLGVISTKPHMTMGMELVTDEKTGAPLDNAKPTTRLALTGRVPVKVSGENGPIVPGDYLTSSSIPGHAMKWTLLDVNSAKDFDDLKKILAENEKRRNAIIGKAVESFSGQGTGKIMVLISLQ